MNQFQTLLDALNAAPGERLFATLWIDEDEREELTFAEFRERARRHAAFLRRQNVGAGDRVVILMPQGLAAMTTFAGAMMLGAVPAILAYPNFKVDPAKYRSGLAGVTKNLSAKLVLLDENFPDELLGHVSLGGETKVVRLRSNTEDEVPQELVSPRVRHDNIAFIQHSAGTTGLQKGVALTHAAVLRQIAHLAKVLEISDQDRIYSWLPLYHDMGLIACFMLPMACHIPLVMHSPLDWVMQPESTLQIITQHGCTLGWMPNFAFQFIPRRTPRSRWADYDLSSLRLLINCSEPVKAASLHEFEQAFTAIGLKTGVLQSSYAMAENVFAVTQSDIQAEAGPARVWADGQRFRGEHRIVETAADTLGAMTFVSSGRLLPGAQVRIVADEGAPLEDGNVGEILVTSDCLFDGYYNRPDLSAQALTQGDARWYRTGDLGFLLGGELYVVGRKKDLLIIGGENIYPQDIEEIVGSHAAIHDGRAIAMGLYNPELGTEDIVVVAEVEREELLAEAIKIEAEIRAQVVAGIGLAPRSVLLKPPRWIVKSTAGKPARAATRKKLLQEHPELNPESRENQLA